ncbi:hypothetical protein ANCDUO_14004 [Ancylostoma duodenale]|uniref:Cysteine rich repeat-containing domain protein n=1 Tax=Ancylostoma duodenale TaxID=51022 RepID=A0A0C2CHH6_9BILA|nr:hypothetical protein ANCDUO_14004 [Ancylostoma duodenale]
MAYIISLMAFGRQCSAFISGGRKRRSGVDQQVNPPVANAAQAANVPPPAKPAENAAANKENIMSFDACKEDIHRLCNKEGVDLKSDISILECLQDAGQSESATLTRQCEDLVWQFKLELNVLHLLTSG